MLMLFVSSMLYQLAFLTPGIMPSSDNSRKQMRHIPKRRM